MDITRLLSHSTRKPKSILRIVISISMVLLVLWLFMVSRMELSTNRQSVLVASQPDSATVTQSVSETLLGTSKATPKSTENQQVAAKDDPGIFRNAFTTFMVMFIILGIVWLWSRKKSTTPAGKQLVNDLGQHVMGQGSQLKIVELNNEVWVLGVTPSSVTLLHRYAKEEWEANKDNQSLENFPEEVQKPDFKAIYSLFGN